MRELYLSYTVSIQMLMVATTSIAESRKSNVIQSIFLHSSRQSLSLPNESDKLRSTFSLGFRSSEL